MLEGFQDDIVAALTGVAGAMILQFVRTGRKVRKLITERDSARRENADFRGRLDHSASESSVLKFQLQWYRQLRRSPLEYEALFRILESWSSDREFAGCVVTTDGRQLYRSEFFPQGGITAFPLTPDAWERLRRDSWGYFSGMTDLVERGESAESESLFGFLLPPQGKATRVLLINRLPSISGHAESDARMIAGLCCEMADHASPEATDSFSMISEEVSLIREMLELRMLTDSTFDRPMELLQEFLKKLAELTGFERASLYLLNDQEPARAEHFSSGGVAVSPALAAAWHRAESLWLREQIPIEAVELESDDSALNSGDGTQVFSGRLLVAIGSGRETLGYLVVTSRTSRQVSVHDHELIAWAAEFLPQALDRALDRAFIEEEARRDSLTNLANRRTFDQELERHLRQGQATESPCCLLLVDLDHFKRINDEQGHLAGDEVLRNVARILRETVGETRVSDRPLVARFGGEEFAVLLPNVNGEGAERIAESIRQAVESCGSGSAAIPIRVTASIGIAVATDDGKTPEELISRADIALYDAKARGRNCVVRFAAGTSSTAQQDESGSRNRLDGVARHLPVVAN